MIGRRTFKRFATAVFGKPGRPLAQTPDVARNRFLFIGGLHRSGTSILHRILCEHAQTSGFSDSGVPQDEGQHLQSVFPAAKRFGGPGRFAFDPAASLMDRPELRSSDSRDRLLREWGALYDLERPVLLEKSPPNLIRSEYFRALLPGSRFAFIVRHPVCVALATRKWSKTSVIELLFHWHLAHRRMADASRDRSDTIVVRYEDFVADPRVFARILDHAGLDAFDPREAVADHNQQYFDLWLQDHQADAGWIARAFPEVESFMAEAGYALRPPFVTASPGGSIGWRGSASP